MSTRTDIARWERISRGFDGPAERPYEVGLCRAANGSAFDWVDPPPSEQRRIWPFVGESGGWCLIQPMPREPGGRSLRATIAALIAAMIATGDA